MEYLNVYDNNKNKLDKKIVRGDKLSNDEHILVAVIFIKNKDNKYLIQKTSLEKGGLYSTTGGHVLYNEDSKTSIIREVKEELGIDIANDDIKYIGSILFGVPFGDIYYLEKDIDIDSVKLQKEEVSYVSYMTKEEIDDLIKKEKITKSHGLMFKYLCEKMNKKITYVTGNWAKIDSARQILEPLGFFVDNIKMETIEIQADDVEDVAKYSAKWASDKLKCSVLKNDTGLFVEALNGFPGVYTHYVDDTLGEDGLLKLLDGVENRKAYFKEVLAFCEYGKEPITFIGITKGTIAKEKSGTYGWSWDFIFIPDGEDKTLGCFPDNERWKFWSLDSYKNLAEYLEKNKIL